MTDIWNCFKLRIDAPCLESCHVLVGEDCTHRFIAGSRERKDVCRCSGLGYPQQGVFADPSSPQAVGTPSGHVTRARQENGRLGKFSPQPHEYGSDGSATGMAHQDGLAWFEMFSKAGDRFANICNRLAVPVVRTAKV
jgi:hypothetical protein